MARLRIGLAMGASALVAVGLVPSAASPLAASPAAERRPLLGIVAEYGVTYVVRVDRRTLRPARDRRIGLGPHLHSWAFSPDRSRLAVSPHPGRVLQFVDARTLRPRGEMVFSAGGLAAWLKPRRLLWVTGSEFVLADPVTRRHVMWRRIDGRVVGGVRAGDRAAFLVAPADGIGPSRLLVIDAAGSTRSVELGRIQSGSNTCGGQRPGIALDTTRQRAFVVDAAGLVAEVELATLAVAYHPLGRTASRLTRDDACESTFRSARWLRDGLFAVSGFDRHDFTATDGRRHTRTDPAGLDLIDVRNWSARTLDERADSFRFAGGQLLATGTQWDSVLRASTGMGIAAYRLDGTQTFQLFDGKPAWIVEAFAGRAYVQIGRKEVTIVDLETGVVAGRRAGPPPRLLLDDGVSLFGR